MRDIYIVTIAGHAGNTAFRKEAISVRTIAEAKLGGEHHAITLANSAETTSVYPLATPENIQQVLTGIGKVMDPKEDLLLVYMGSHGDKDRFTLRFDGFPLNDLSSRDIAKMFDRAKIGPRMLFVSACYSGSLIEKLKGPDTLVVTASSDDRVAYGDIGLKDFTFFGQAIFTDGLQSTRSLTKAFAAARTESDGWEKQYNLTASYPQISMGSRIEPLLIEMGLADKATTAQ